MLIFLGKYVYTLVLCIPMVLRGSCDYGQLAIVRDEEDLQIYRTSACTAKRLLDMHETFEQSFIVCNGTDGTKTNTNSLNKVTENFNLKLVCRDDRSLTFRIEMSRELVVNQYNRSNGKEVVIYVIHVILAEELFIYLSNEPFFTIDELKYNTTYNISAVAVYSNFEYSIVASHQPYSTLRRGYKPNKILDISEPKFKSDGSGDEMRLSATINWTPSSDRTCHYNIIYFSTNNIDSEYIPLEIRNPKDLYSYTLENLTFSTSYRVAIRSKNTNNSSKESDLFWMSFETPSCLDWHKNNLFICAPPEPAELFVEQTFIAGDNFSLNISWQRPENHLLPDYYTVKVLDLNQSPTAEVNSRILNVTKDRNYIFIPSMTIYGMLYEVQLFAHTPGGKSVATVTKQTAMRVIVTDKMFMLKVIIAIAAPIVCTVIVTLTICIVWHRKAKLKRYQERCKYFEELEKKAPIDPKPSFAFPSKNVTASSQEITKFQLELEEKLLLNDSFEINRNNLTLHEVIGEGAFGFVRRGIFNNSETSNSREVAVKMLKDRPSPDDVRAFRREIEVMKSVGKHPNIVGIIGHSTRQQNEMLLLTEYCSLGNLQNFLREEWKYLHELSLHSPAHLITPEEAHTKQRENIFNFEASIVKKIELKQKPIDITISNNKDNTTSNIKKNSLASVDSSMAKNNQSLVLFNKSYGYDEICTNSCKCQVDVVNASIVIPSFQTSDTENSSIDLTPVQPSNITKSKIAISSSCECHHKTGKQHLPSSMANEGYSLVGSNIRKPNNIVKSNSDEVLIPTVKREPLRPIDLLDIAKQVATGMEFLSKNKVVHRDLAARNVLVSHDRTVKIADFGLSRDVYQENVYKKTGNGKLPIKWLALESMTHQVYTSHSDVWSFGILLYEIATLGGIPYPSIQTSQLLNLLKTGYRMEKPRSCGQEFYNLMASCWNASPSKRPTFTDVRYTLERLINDCPERQIENLFLTKIQRKTEQNILNNGDDAYLEPLESDNTPYYLYK